MLTVSLDRPDLNYYLSTGGHFTIGIEDATGVVLGSVRDFANVQSISVPVFQSGTYYARIGNAAVSPDRPNANFADGQYSVSASYSATSTAGLETESNDTRVTADALAMGGVVTGQLSSTSDVDYFAFNVGAAGTLRLDMTAPGYPYFTGLTVSLVNTSGDDAALVHHRDGSPLCDFWRGPAGNLLRPGQHDRYLRWLRPAVPARRQPCAWLHRTGRDPRIGRQR